MRHLTPRNLVGLAGGITAAAGALVLRLMQPVDLSWAPFVCVAAASLVLAAAAPAVDFIRSRRARSRRIAAFRTTGLEMVEEGYFQTADPDAVDRFIQQAMAYESDQRRLREGGVDR